MGIGAAIVGAAIIGAGSGLYQAEQQKKIAKADRARREQEAAAARAESDRIASETKPEEESLADTKFGVGNDDSFSGGTEEFIIPKTSSLGSSSNGRSGLGFKV